MTTPTAGGTPLTTIAYDASDLIEVQDPLDRVTEFFPDTASYTYEAVDAEDRWASGSPGTARGAGVEAHINLRGAY